MQAPIGMVRSEELLNILLGLWLAGVDEQTLNIVAQSTGVGSHFKWHVNRLVQQNKLAEWSISKRPSIMAALSLSGGNEISTTTADKIGKND